MMSGTTRTTSNPGAIAAPLLSRDFVLLLVMQAVFGICSSTFFLLPKVVAAYWGGDALDIALFAAAFGIGSVVAVPLIGPVVDRHGLRVPLVAACVLVMTSALGFGAVVRGLGPLALVLRGLQGLAWTTVFSCGLVATTLVTPRDRIAQGLGLYGVSNLATNAIAPAIAEPLFEQIGLAPTFLLAAAFGAASIPIAAAVRTATPAGARAVSLRSLFAMARNLRLAAIAAISGTCLALVLTFYQPYALDQGAWRVRTFFLGYTVGAVGIRVASGRLIDRLGHRRSLVLAMLVYGVATAAMKLIAPGRLLGLGFAFGTAHGLFLPALLAFTVAGTDLPTRGRLLAVMNGCLMGGALFVPLLGSVVASIGYGDVFVASGVLMLALTLLAPPT
jgi:MFS family permease